MQKTLLFVFSFFSIILCNYCSHKLNAEGTFQKSSVTANANLNDWDLPLRFGNKPGTIQYSITNDRENVYIVSARKRVVFQM